MSRKRLVAGLEPNFTWRLGAVERDTRMQEP